MTNPRRQILVEVIGVAGAAIATSAVIAIFLKDPNEVTVASSMALAVLVTFVVATVLSTRIRHRQAHALLHAVLKADTEFRTTIQEPTWVGGRHKYGYTGANPDLSPATEAKIVEIMERPAFSEVDVAVLVHPIPKSATLRAAALRGSDPMDRKDMIR